MEKRLPLHLENFGGWLNYPDYYFFWAYKKGHLFNSSNYENPGDRDAGRRDPAPAVDDPDWAPKIKRMFEIAFEDLPRIPLYQPALNVAANGAGGYEYWFHRQLDIRGLKQRLTGREEGTERCRRSSKPSGCAICCRRSRWSSASVVISFLLTRALPGDPAVYFAGPAADEKSIAEIRASLGLDRSLPEQFLIYLGDLARGDLGQSISTGLPVAEELARRLPASLELTLVALLLSCAIAIPLGVLAATRPGSAGRPSLPGAGDGGRLPADLLHRRRPDLRLLLSAGLGAVAARAARLHLYRARSRHRLLH